MSSHLNEEQITDALTGANEEPCLQHLEACPECRGQVEAARVALAGFSREAQREAERDESFWARQRLVIASRIEQGARRRMWQVVWAGAAASAAAVLLWINLAQEPPKPVVNAELPRITNHYENNDELLLRHVEVALERPAPAALAPAELLTAELNRRARPRKQVSRGIN